MNRFDFHWAVIFRAVKSRLLVCILAAMVAGRGAAAQSGSISGVVVQGERAIPVAQAVVRMQNSDLQAITAVNGTFRIGNVPVGRQVLIVEHIAFGTHSDTVRIEPGKDARLQIRISPQAIQLSPILVEATSELDRRRRSTGSAFREIQREQIELAQQKGFNLAELLREGMLSAQVSGERRGGTYCVEYRSGSYDTTRSPTCREVAVYMDGVRVGNPGFLYTTMPLRDVERVEMLSPAEAGTQYGMVGGRGVLLIQTRQGVPTGRGVRNSAPLLTGFDWSQETRPYRWARVSGGSLLGNTVGLGVGLLLADQCLTIDEGFRGLRSECHAVTTVGAGFLVLALPAFTSTVAARWAGTTDRSQGRFMPAALLATLTTAAGFLLYTHGRTEDSEAARTGGIVMLTVAVPVVTTFSDRIFREFRQ